METETIPAEGRMERRKREIRHRIVAAAMELFERQGFANTTMEQIAEAADVARKTLYNHFPVKEAIADEYLKGISQELARKARPMLQDLPDTRSRLLAALDQTYAWVEINPEITKACLVYRMKNVCLNGEKQLTGTQSTMAEIIRQGQKKGELRPDLALNRILIYIDLLRGSVVTDWLQDTSKFNLREEMAQMVDMLLYGISTG